MVDLRKPLAFTGDLVKGDHRQAVAFQLSLTSAGALAFEFERLPFSKETAWIRSHEAEDGETVSYYALTARAGEVAFETRHLHLNALVHIDDGEGFDSSQRTSSLGYLSPKWRTRSDMRAAEVRSRTHFPTSGSSRRCWVRSSMRAA